VIGQRSVAAHRWTGRLCPTEMLSVHRANMTGCDALVVPTLLLVPPDSPMGPPAGGGAQRPGPDRCGARCRPVRPPRPARQVSGPFTSSSPRWLGPTLPCRRRRCTLKRVMLINGSPAPWAPSRYLSGSAAHGEHSRDCNRGEHAGPHVRTVHDSINAAFIYQHATCEADHVGWLHVDCMKGVPEAVGAASDSHVLQRFSRLEGVTESNPYCQLGNPTRTRPPRSVAPI
jgi:hypothetical protein